MTFVFQMTFMRLPYFIILSLRGNIVTVAIPRQGEFPRGIL